MEICRFCLKTIENPLPIDKMVKEIIGFLMLKLDLHITPEPVMCCGCAETLQTAFDFKSACIYTENCLSSFIEDKSESRLDLREIYLKVNHNEDVESVEGREVCRFCMKPSDSGLCTPVVVIEENVEIKKLLENYLPDVVMGVIEKPVACENCRSFLHQYSLFVTSLSNVEQQIQSYSKKNLGRDSIGEIDLRQVRDFSLGNVTKREVETIGNDKVAKKEVVIFSDIESEEKIIAEEKIKFEEKEIGASKISMVLSETERREQEEFDSFAGSAELFTLNRIPHIEEVDMKGPFLEPFGTEVKGKFHEEDAVRIEEVKGESQKIQRTLSPHEIDECQELEARLGIKLMEFEIKKEDDECDGNENDTLSLVDPSMIFFEDVEMKPTVVETSFNPEAYHTAIENGSDQNTSEMEAGNPVGHEVKSVEDVEGRIYPCQHCPYKAKRKCNLWQHMLVHKDVSEIKTYQCKLCPYKTKRRYALTVHMLIHKDPSETPTYNCNLCSYKAIRKANLKEHMLIHKNATDVKTYVYKRKPAIYQCSLCPCKVKGKQNLTQHMRTHVTTHDCDLCAYKTKSMKRFVQHTRIHKDDSKNSSEMDTEDPKPVGDVEGRIYRCKFCPYKAKLKYYLTKHMLVHKDISEVTTYQCPLCPHKAKLKYYLKKHMLVHQDISEVAGHQCPLCPHKSKRKGDLVKHMLSHEGSSKVKPYDCSLCSFRAKQKAHLTAHMWIHEDILKDASEMETNLQVKSEVEDLEEAVYRCNFCPYETRLEKYLIQHMLSHKDNPENAPEIEPSLPVKPVEDVEKTIYRCHLCRYKAKRKATLTRHMLVHKDISEVAGYQCKLCPRKTKRKIDLVNHVKWIHEGSSRVTMYVCNVCSHETKRKRDMKSHMLIHKDDSKNASEMETNFHVKLEEEEEEEETIYRCNLCPYEAKRENYLTKHMLVHKDISEIEAYQCKLCPQKTKRKHDLVVHMRRMHDDSSQNVSEMETDDPNGLQVKPVGDLEKTVYRCKLCPYKTKLRGRLTKHMLIHEDISEDAPEIETSLPVKLNEDVEETIHRCKLCPYKARLKHYLTRHMLVHKDITEVTVHQCKLCPYKTKWKRGLTQHMLVHKDFSEVTTFDCNFCSFKAKRKQSLISHIPIHMENFKDAKFAQNQQESVSEHQELEGCSTIKSEEVDIKNEEDT